MDKLILTTAIAALYASTTIAGSVAILAPAEPVVVAPVPVATDWAGFYAGGLAGTGGGTQIDDFDFDFDSGSAVSDFDWENDLDGSMYGAFTGINFQSGSIVYGVEAAYSLGSIGFYDDDPSFPNGVEDAIEDAADFDSNDVDEFGGEFSSFIDLKARVGFAAGRALIYSFAGWSFGEYQYDGIIDGDPETVGVSTDGMNYGAGIDMLVTDNFFMGLEYIIREQAANVGSGNVCCSGDYTWDMSATIQEVQLRAGWQF